MISNSRTLATRKRVLQRARLLAHLTFALLLGALIASGCGNSTEPGNGAAGAPAGGAGPGPVGGAPGSVAGTPSSSGAPAAGAPVGGSPATGGMSSAGAPSGGADGCPANTSACGAECKNLAVDVKNCGMCGVACRADQVCQSGACACATTRRDCNGACIDVGSDPMNCGACGTACPANQVCSQGSCGTGCAAGLTRCGASCVDLTGHQSNCGMCGRACPADQTCAQSMCRCRTGQASCNGGACQDVLSDEANCGACGKACASGATCTNGECVCPRTTDIVCANRCVDATADAANCGTCGTACGNGTSCLFGACINPSSVNCNGSATGRVCTRDAFITLGKYWVNNNQWGVANGVSGQQCIFSMCQTGDLVGWGTDWNWSGGGNGVKTYVSLVYGWQWGFRIANTGFPIQLSANRAVNCGWSYTVSTTGTINVSYDMWFHTTPNPTSTNDPTDEVMVWLYRSGGAGPIGARQTTVTIAGASWDLHRGMNGNTNVFSYIRTENATTAVLNMTAFTSDLVTRGWLQSSKYLSAVQAGTEVYTGSGSMTTHGFYCRIQ